MPRMQPPGLGPLSAWSTEVTLPTGGTFSSPPKGSPRSARRSGRWCANPGSRGGRGTFPDDHEEEHADLVQGEGAGAGLGVVG